jgi:hypothetical protein
VQSPDEVAAGLEAVADATRARLCGGEMELRRALVKASCDGGRETMLGVARDLSAAASKAGLVVTRMMPCGQSFWIELWQPDGEIWADGTGESVEDVAEHVRRWMRSGGRGRRAHLVDQARRVGAVLRVAGRVRQELAARAEMRDGWRASAIDLLDKLQEAAELSQHPDDVDRAITSMMDLAGLWLEQGDAERVCLEGGVLPEDGGS